MRCIVCGNEMPDTDTECAACGAVVDNGYTVMGPDKEADIVPDVVLDKPVRKTIRLEWLVLIIGVLIALCAFLIVYFK